MKIITLLLITSIFFGFSSIAQEDSEDFEITWSKPMEYKANLHFIGAKKTDDGYLVFDKETIKGPGGYRYYIEFFNDNMEFVKKVDISEEVDEENYIILDILNYGDNFLLITSRTFKKEEKEEIYIQKIGESGENIIGKRVKIHEEAFYSKKQKSTYRLSVSPNDNFLLVQVIPSWRKKFKQNLSLILLDKDLEIHWAEDDVVIEGESESSKELFSINNIILNDFGVVYFLGKEADSRERLSYLLTGDRMTFSKNYEVFYQILRLVEGQFTGESIKLDKAGLRSMDIQLSKDNTLHCVGYFTENPKESSIEGVASYTIDSDLNNISSENFLLFDEGLHLSGLKGKGLEKADKIRKKDIAELRHLVNEQILQHEDGSLTLIGEVQYTYSYTTGTGDNQTTKTKYVYGNMFLSRIDPNGEILSNTLIRKSTEYSRPTPKHNLMFTSNHHFVRLSEERRSSFDDADPDKNGKDNLMAVTMVNEDGEISEKVLFDPTDKPDHKKDRLGNLAINGVVLSNNDVIILAGHDKKEYKFIRIKPLFNK